MIGLSNFFPNTNGIISKISRNVVILDFELRGNQRNIYVEPPFQEKVGKYRVLSDQKGFYVIPIRNPFAKSMRFNESLFEEKNLDVLFGFFAGDFNKGRI